MGMTFFERLVLVVLWGRYSLDGLPVNMFDGRNKLDHHADLRMHLFLGDVTISN